MSQDQTQQNETPKDSILRAVLLKRLGVIPKGVSGCHSCDMMGYNVCKCPGKKSGGGDEKTDEKKADPKKNNFDDDLFDKEGLSKNESKLSAPYKRIVNPILTATIAIVDNKELSEEEKNALLKIFDKLKLAFEEFKKELGLGDDYTSKITNTTNEKSITFNIPNAEHHDNFIARLINKGLLMRPEPRPQAKKEEDQKNQYTTPTPTSTTLKPSWAKL
jgi:hypothetical protein